MHRRSISLRISVVVALGAVVAYLALRASPYLQYIPWMPRRIGIWADAHGIVRNVAAFFVFSFIVLLVLRPRWWWVGALCFFGIMIEVAQLWIPGRVFDWWDIVATIAGILLAWPIARVLRPAPGIR